MGIRGLILSALFLVGGVVAQNETVDVTSRSLEPHGTGYHPLRHHQRPKDINGLRFYSGRLEALDDDVAVGVDDRRIRTNPPGYYNPHPPTMRPPTGPSGPASTPSRKPLKVIYGWTEIDFTWPSPQARRIAINSGAFQPHNIIPLDFDIFEHNGNRKMFVTMPRGDGVPVALATISSEGRKKSPRLSPYPDWSWHGNNTCEGISSVYRIMVDECGRLWVLDRGNTQCRPQLLLFDLRTDILLSQYRFPPEVIRNGSNLITVAVDIRNGKCADPFAYIADVVNPAIIVFDGRRGESWRVEHPSMRPILQYATYQIAGREFYLTDGVFGLALGPLHRGERILYYHPLASVYESWVPTSVLRQKQNFVNGQNRASQHFQTSTAARASQSAAEAMDDQGTLFSGLLTETALTCWNSDLEFGGWNLPVVAADEEALQFPSGMKIHNGYLYMITSRYQNFATDTMDWNDINYRVLSGRVEDLKRGTMCDSKTASTINALG